MRSGDTDNDIKPLCGGSAGGPQGSAIKIAAFPVLIGPALIPGDDGGPMCPPAELAKADLKPSRSRFSALTNTPDAYFGASPPDCQG